MLAMTKELWTSVMSLDCDLECKQTRMHYIDRMSLVTIYVFKPTIWPLKVMSLIQRSQSPTGVMFVFNVNPA